MSTHEQSLHVKPCLTRIDSFIHSLLHLSWSDPESEQILWGRKWGSANKGQRNRCPTCERVTWASQLSNSTSPGSFSSSQILPQILVGSSSTTQLDSPVSSHTTFLCVSTPRTDLMGPRRFVCVRCLVPVRTPCVAGWLAHPLLPDDLDIGKEPRKDVFYSSVLKVYLLVSTPCFWSQGLPVLLPWRIHPCSFHCVCLGKHFVYWPSPC